MRESPECLRIIEDARNQGVDVTTETYPYTAAMTTINTAFFNSGWQQKRDLDYSDIELPGTGERLTRERFETLHSSSEPQTVLIHLNPEEVVSNLVADPSVIIASDGLSAHPRAVGTFARVLGKYVRTENVLTVPEAVRKMSYLPVLRLERMSSMARRLGRIQPGAAADIVVFDSESIEDRATFSSPDSPSVGVRYSLVGGVVVVDQGILVDSVRPGRPITRDLQ
jgi:N-acyl-D-aspartate/D-glutamate deacylase